MIIDTNRLSYFLNNPSTEDTKPINKWLKKHNGKLIYTGVGDYSKEIGDDARKRLRAYKGLGQARLINAQTLTKGKHLLKQLLERNKASPKSNDTHILELALASGVRLLYTFDQDLQQDFKNPDIINNPRGKVYSSAKNKKRLLRRDTCP